MKPASLAEELSPQRIAHLSFRMWRRSEDGRTLAALLAERAEMLSLLREAQYECEPELADRITTTRTPADKETR